MNEWIIYLIEANAVLAVLYLLYVLLLKKETFFNFNRFYLLSILAFSLSIPLLSLDVIPSSGSAVEQPIVAIGEKRAAYYDALADWTMSAQRVATPIDGTDVKPSGMAPSQIVMLVLLAVYGTGCLALLTRLFWSLRWIVKTIKIHPKESIGGISLVKVSYPIAPFSFMRYVFVHDAMSQTNEFEQILAHERTHIRQKHSLDLFIVQLVAAFLWFNPLVWHLIKSLKTTHEYIADRKMITQGYSLVEYQTLLLRQLISNNSFGLVHNFNLSFIKKRITMMKIKESGWTGRAKVALTFIATVTLSIIIVQCNSRVDDQVSLVSKDAPIAGNSGKVDLPILPASNYKVEYNQDDVLQLEVANSRLTLNGNATGINEIVMTIENSSITAQGVVLVRIDRAQPMSFVRDVFWELRKADRRKLLYLGQTSEGEQVEMPFLLPPHPESELGVQMPVLDDQYVAEHNIDLYKIDLGETNSPQIRKQVYDFVMKHVENGLSNYVISAKYQDNDLYESYLQNLVSINEGFNQIYQERAQAMFGKNFWEMSNLSKGKLKEEYIAVRKGIPRAISIADE